MTERDKIIELIDTLFLYVCMYIYEHNYEACIDTALELTKTLRLPEIKLCVSENEYIFITKALNHVLSVYSYGV